MSQENKEMVHSKRIVKEYFTLQEDSCNMLLAKKEKFGFDILVIITVYN